MIKWTLAIKFHHPTCQKPEMRKIATHKFFDFYLKKRDSTNLFDQIHSTVLFPISFCFYRACFTHLVSSNLSCNICFWYYDQLVHFNKEINANVYRHSFWEYSKRFHCSFEWHLTPHMTLSIETCITAFPEGVRLIQVSLQLFPQRLRQQPGKFEIVSFTKLQCFYHCPFHYSCQFHQCCNQHHYYRHQAKESTSSSNRILISYLR